jgi:hypothetical protein
MPLYSALLVIELRQELRPCHHRGAFETKARRASVLVVAEQVA